MHAYWNHRPHGRSKFSARDWYGVPVRILQLHKNTAHIEARRRDGTITRRWVKLSRLSKG